jgi:uncharacterized protein involved in propanediol utilization
MAGATLARGPAAMGTGRAFGTFGELLQGVLASDGRDFLVTLPIARWSVARYRAEPGTPLRTTPADKNRSGALARRMLTWLGLEPCGRLHLSSELPVGKGMASSSADLVATARAICDAAGTEPSPWAIEDLLRDVEPTDGVMYDGVVAFYHREVRLRQALGRIPPLTIVGIDEGGTIDTVSFNGIPKPFTMDDRYDYQSMLDSLERAIAHSDVHVLGAVATRSAVMNQRLAPKRLLGAVIRLAEDTGALGVVAAHSGTRLGVLLADADPDYTVKFARTVDGCRRLGVPVSVEHTL